MDQQSSVQDSQSSSFFSASDSASQRNSVEITDTAPKGESLPRPAQNKSKDTSQKEKKTAKAAVRKNKNASKKKSKKPKRVKQVKRLSDPVVYKKLYEECVSKGDFAQAQPKLNTQQKTYYGQHGVKYFNTYEEVTKVNVVSEEALNVCKRLGIPATKGIPKGDNPRHQVHACIRRFFAHMCIQHVKEPGVILNLGGDRWLCHILKKVFDNSRYPLTCYNVLRRNTNLQHEKRMTEVYPYFFNGYLESLPPIDGPVYVFGYQPYSFTPDDYKWLYERYQVVDFFVAMERFSSDTSDILRISDHSISWKDLENQHHVTYDGSEVYDDVSLENQDALFSCNEIAFDVKRSFSTMKFFSVMRLSEEQIPLWKPITLNEPYQLIRKVEQWSIDNEEYFAEYLVEYAKSRSRIVQGLFRVLPLSMSKALLKAAQSIGNYDVTVEPVELIVWNPGLDVLPKKYDSSGRHDLGLLVRSSIENTLCKEVLKSLSDMDVSLLRITSDTVLYQYYHSMREDISKEAKLQRWNADVLARVDEVRKLQSSDSSSLFRVFKKFLIIFAKYSWIFIPVLSRLLARWRAKPSNLALIWMLQRVTSNETYLDRNRYFAFKFLGPLFEEIVSSIPVFGNFFRILIYLGEVCLTTGIRGITSSDNIVRLLCHLFLQHINRSAGVGTSVMTHWMINQSLISQGIPLQLNIWKMIWRKVHGFYEIMYRKVDELCVDIRRLVYRPICSYSEYLELYRRQLVHDSDFQTGIIPLKRAEVPIPVAVGADHYLYQVLGRKCYRAWHKLPWELYPKDCTPRYHKIAANSSLLYSPGGTNMASFAMVSRILCKKSSDCRCTTLEDSPWCDFPLRWREAYQLVAPVFEHLFGDVCVDSTQSYIDGAKKKELYQQVLDKGLMAGPTIYQQKHDEMIGYKDYYVCPFCEEYSASRTVKCNCDEVKPSTLIHFRQVRSRIFEAFAPDRNLAMAAYLKAAQQNWHDKVYHVYEIEGVRFMNIWACGLTPEALSDVYDTAMEAASNGIQVFVQLGDDLAGWFFFQQNDGIHIYGFEGDYSSFDRSQGIHVLKEVHLPIFQIFCKEEDKIHFYFEGRTGHRVFRIKGKKYRLKFPVQVCSGEQATCFVNSCSNTTTTVGYLVEAHKNRYEPHQFLRNWISFLGKLGIKASFCNFYENPRQITFLKGKWWLCTNGSHAWAPLPSQILAKACKIGTSPLVLYCKFFDIKVPRLCPANYTIRKEYSYWGMYLAAFALSFFCGVEIPAIPIILEYLSLLRNFGRKFVIHKNLDYEATRDRVMELRDIYDSRFIYPIVPGHKHIDYNVALYDISVRYDLYDSQIMDLCQSITQISNPWDFLVSSVANQIVHHDYLI